VKTELQSLVHVARAALAQNDDTPENERISCRRLLEIAMPFLESVADSHDMTTPDLVYREWMQKHPHEVSAGLASLGVNGSIVHALMTRLIRAHNAAFEMARCQERVRWLKSQLPDSLHWPPSPRDPYARAPADSDG
jgi:hypothetical protein